MNIDVKQLAEKLKIPKDFIQQNLLHYIRNENLTQEVLERLLVEDYAIYLAIEEWDKQEFMKNEW